MTMHELWSALGGLPALFGLAADPDASLSWPDLPLPWLAAAVVLGLGLIGLAAYPAWRERRLVAQARRALAALGETAPLFAWPALERRIRAAAGAVYAGWSTGDLGAAAGLLTEDLRLRLQGAWSEEAGAVGALPRLRRLLPILVDADGADPARLVVLVHLAQGRRHAAHALGQARQLWSWVLLDGRWYLDDIAAAAELRQVLAGGARPAAPDAEAPSLAA